MSPEAPHVFHPKNAFGFTMEEQLREKVTDQRFREILTDKKTIVHQVSESSNSYGEFLFVEASRPVGDQRVMTTFYGLGFHAHRGWCDDVWFWNKANSSPESLRQEILKDEAEKLILERRVTIAPYVPME